MKTRLLVAILFAAALYGANGTVVGSPTFGAAHFSTGMTAVSASNYVSLPSGEFSFVTTSSSWTIEMWLQSSAGAGAQVVITTQMFWLGTLNGQFNFSVPAGQGNISAGPTITDGNWHLCNAVVTGGTNLKLFVDGVLISNASVGGFSGGGTIGNVGTNNPPGYSWLGGIDEVSFWSYAKYSTTFTPPATAYLGTESGLESLYHLDGNAIDSKTSGPPSPNIYADDANILYTGRWAHTGAGITSSAITINTGSRLDVTLSGTSAITLLFGSTGLSYYPDILYEVDGGPPTRVTLAAGGGMQVAVNFPIASMTIHHLRVWAEGVPNDGYEWTLQQGALLFGGLLVDTGSTVPIAANPNTLEVIGDSIVASDREVGVCESLSTDTPVCMAGHNSWAQLTGSYLGLRVVQTGFGGTGLTTGGVGGVPAAISSFPYVYSGVAYNPAIKPTAVVIEQGTNDSGASSGAYMTALGAYLTAIRAAYPQALIFCVGLANNSHAADMSSEVTSFRDSRVFYLNYTALPYTGGVHPDSGGAALIAARLSSDIQSQLNLSGVVLGAGGSKFSIGVN